MTPTSTTPSPSFDKQPHGNSSATSSTRSLTDCSMLSSISSSTLAGGSFNSIQHNDAMEEPVHFPTGITGRLSQAKGILTTLQSRLTAQLDTQTQWAAGNQNVLPAMESDQGALIHPIDALSPCPTVNTALSELVGTVCLTPAAQIEVDGVLNGLTSKEVAQFRALSTVSEERLEKSALNLLFAIHNLGVDSTADESPPLLDDINKATEQLQQEHPELPKAMAALKALIVEHPTKEYARNPQLPGQPFIYLDNYIHIVDAELQLLTKPLPTTKQPLFNDKSLSQQQFAFVGAGFPLTALALHIKTGANITLVDRDGEAIQNAKQLLELCHQYDVVDKNAFTLIHEDALNCAFISPGAQPAPSQNANTTITSICMDRRTTASPRHK